MSCTVQSATVAMRESEKENKNLKSGILFHSRWPLADEANCIQIKIATF